MLRGEGKAMQYLRFERAARRDCARRRPVHARGVGSVVAAVCIFAPVNDDACVEERGAKGPEHRGKAAGLQAGSACLCAGGREDNEARQVGRASGKPMSGAPAASRARVAGHVLTGKRSYTLIMTSVRVSERVDLWEEEREGRVPEGRPDFLEDMANDIRRRWTRQRQARLQWSKLRMQLVR